MPAVFVLRETCRETDMLNGQANEQTSALVFLKDTTLRKGKHRSDDQLSQK